MLIYRVEDKNGRGVYRAESPLLPSAADTYDRYVNAARDEVGSCYRNPEPSNTLEEGSDLYHQYIGSGISYFHFGFKNIDQFLNWFPEVQGRKGLKDRQQVLSIYEVPRQHIVFGYYQLAFMREEATFVRHLDVVSCLEVNPQSLPYLEVA